MGAHPMPLWLVGDYPQALTKLDFQVCCVPVPGTEFHFVKIIKAGTCHLAKPPMLSAVLIFLLSFFFLSALFLFGNIQKPLDVIFRSLIGFHQLLSLFVRSYMASGAGLSFCPWRSPMLSTKRFLKYSSHKS